MHSYCETTKVDNTYTCTLTRGVVGEEGALL